MVSRAVLQSVRNFGVSLIHGLEMYQIQTMARAVQACLKPCACFLALLKGSTGDLGLCAGLIAGLLLPLSPAVLPLCRQRAAPKHLRQCDQ